MKQIRQLADVKYPTFAIPVKDEAMGVETLILNCERANVELVEDYVQLKELLGMKLLYAEPIMYGNDYDGLMLYFIDEYGQQKCLSVSAVEELNKVDILILK